MKLGRACAALGCALVLGSVPPAAPSQLPTPPGIRLRVFHLVDRSREIRLPDGRLVPRPLDTVIRYPAAGGPYPLIVFGHGFALTPAAYRGLLLAWARAGYVVAAPVFPLENANAPGGPNESDLVNQPKDVSVVIGKLLALSARPKGALGGKLDPTRIAVSGHSDGAETALAVAYDHRFRDPRVRAAIVLSGSALPGMGAFPRAGPPLLAVQGTADTINAPATTLSYFQRAPRPKFLLWLLRASHRSPYTDEQPQLGIVEHTTIAFLGHYLKDRPLRAIAKAAKRRGLTRLTADP
jgi:dienelactone hydrolase